MGEQSEHLREEQDEHDTEPEAGKRDTEQRHARRQGVPDRVSPNGGEDAERHRDEKGEEKGAPRERERGAQTIDDERRHRLARLERAAEVSTNRRQDPARVLHGKRAIESKPRSNLSRYLRRQLASNQHR